MNSIVPWTVLQKVILYFRNIFHFPIHVPFLDHLYKGIKNLIFVWTVNFPSIILGTVLTKVILSKHVSFSYFISCFSIKLMLYSSEAASLYQMISFRLRLWLRLSAFVSGASLIKLAPQTTEQKQESQLQFNIHCSPPIPVGQLMNKQWILILYFVLKIYRALRRD